MLIVLHENAEGPDVWLDGVLVVKDRLERHPANGDGVALVATVVVLQVDLVGEAEVRDLDAAEVVHQAVTWR